MSKKSNVHPDYYKTAGRDRPDDAAAARLNRAIVAKMASRERPDRMKKSYFERPEPPGPADAEDTVKRAPKKTSLRDRAAGKAGKKKSAVPRREATSRKDGPKRSAGRGARKK